MKKSVFLDHLSAAAKQEGTSLSRMAAYAASLGYAGADVRVCSADALRETKRILAEAGLAIASVYGRRELHKPHDRDEAHAFFALLRECGCGHALILPPSESASTIGDEEAAGVYAHLAALCEIGEEYGVAVSLESFDAKDAILSDTAALARAFAAVPRLCHTLDTGNYAYFGESPIEAISRFGDRIVHVHLKDRARLSPCEGDKARLLADGSEAYSCAVGAGFVPIERCLALLRARSYRGYLSAEHFGMARMKAAIRDSAAYIDRALAELGCERPRY